MITFLPAFAVPLFTEASSLVDKLRIGAQALAHSHNFPYNEDNINDEYEPYVSIRGFNIPTYADVMMMVEYLNNLAISQGAEYYPFYMDASPEWETICVSICVNN